MISAGTYILAETTFPDFITARRRELELTLGDVGSRVGVSPITVSNWSNGQSTPKKENFVALADALQLPADELAEMAGVKLDPAPEPEPEVILESVETATSHDGAAAHTEDPQAIPGVQIPTVEHPSLAEADEAQAKEAEADVVEAVEEKTEPVGDATPGVDEQVAPQVVTGPDVMPRVTAAEPTTTQLGPLTYVQDPKQLLRYRIRWGITTVVLIIMAFVLVWALAGLIDSLSSVKESVTP